MTWVSHRGGNTDGYAPQDALRRRRRRSRRARRGVCAGSPTAGRAAVADHELDVADLVDLEAGVDDHHDRARGGLPIARLQGLIGERNPGRPPPWRVN